MARQNTLNVSLTPQLRNYVRAKVRSGGYESASEVIRDSLRALQEREQVSAAYWSDVRGKVAVARRDVAEGRVEDGDAAMDEIIADLHGEQRQTKKKQRR
jgi:antitoxin ParD1/3/4